jgi:DNA polymerase III epsilon subunit-like protein
MLGWGKRGAGPDKDEFPPDAPLHSLRYAVLDTELTSLDHRTNRMLSVGAVAMQGPSIHLGEQFYRVVNPQVAIPAESVIIHKLRSEDVEAGTQMEECLQELCGFVKGAVLVGHFVEIELKILRKEMARTGHAMGNPAVCTAQVHRWILRHGPYSEDLSARLEKLDLGTLAEYYAVPVDDAHHALSDAFLTARVWQKMLYTLQAKGVLTLKKLLQIGGK